MVKSSSRAVGCWLDGWCAPEKLLLQQFVVALNAETARAACKNSPHEYKRIIDCEPRASDDNTLQTTPEAFILNKFLRHAKCAQ
jgi:hypothetical protein